MSNNDTKEKLTSLLCWEKIYNILPNEYKKKFIPYHNRIKVKPIEYFDSYYAWINLRQTLVEKLPMINEENKKIFPWLIQVIKIYNNYLNDYNNKKKSE
jgi:hypothetical protein